MKPTHQHPDGELHELSHEPVPGFRTGFWIVFAVMTMVLVIAFLMGAEVSTHH